MCAQATTHTITSHLEDAVPDDCVPLLAREVGSRARGYAGRNSDHDVFVVYARPRTKLFWDRDRAFRTEIPADETDLDVPLEIEGWSLRKFVGGDGLGGSNPTALEFCASEQQHLEHPNTRVQDAMFELLMHAKGNFVPIALVEHYRSMAASNTNRYLESGYTLADDFSYGSLASYVEFSGIVDPDGDSVQVDSEATDVGTDGIDVVGLTSEFMDLGHIDIETAIEDGLVRETALERTPKRYLVVAQALLKACYVEDTKAIPPMDIRELFDYAHGRHIGDKALSECWEMLGMKRVGYHEDVVVDSLHTWIQSELEREVEHDGLVDRFPDDERIEGLVEKIHENVFGEEDHG